MKLASLKQPFLKQVYTKPVDSVFREALIGIVSAIDHAALFWILHKSFPYFFQTKKLFGAGYPLVWYILNQLFTGSFLNSGWLKK